MRRKTGTLVPLEVSILVALANLQKEGIVDSYGYQLAQHIAHADDNQLLTAYGTLYRALGRLVDRGMLTSRWEDAQIGARESRPSRRLYCLTHTGAEVAQLALAEMSKQLIVPARRRVTQS